MLQNEHAQMLIKRHDTAEGRITQCEDRSRDINHIEARFLIYYQWEFKVTTIILENSFTVPVEWSASYDTIQEASLCVIIQEK